MNTAMKVQHILVSIGCLLVGVSACDNVVCRKMNFNQINSINAIETCYGFNNVFTIKSFEENSSVLPYSDDSVYYLSNLKEGWSCFSTIEVFTLEEDTEFDAAIYLQSVVIEDMSEVEMEVLDLDGEKVILVANVTATRDFKWNSYNMKFGRKIANAKIRIRAFVTTSANMAIQYLHILNPTIDESMCDGEATTNIETTTEADKIIKVETATETRADTCTSACTCTCSCTLDTCI